MTIDVASLTSVAISLLLLRRCVDSAMIYNYFCFFVRFIFCHERALCQVDGVVVDSYTTFWQRSIRTFWLGVSASVKVTIRDAFLAKKEV